MPWKAVSVGEQRAKFLLDYKKRVLSRETTMSALCEEHGISRKTGYQLVARYEASGWSGLEERSRAPHSGRHWIDPEIIGLVLDVRHQFPFWGARKIVAYLNQIDPDRTWPVASVVHEWIRRAGLVTERRPRRSFPHPGPPPAVAIDKPNQQWSVDFKGHFRTGDRKYCYPLTVLDSFSRYIVGCTALPATSFEQTWPAFERLFREFGLPEAILSDNGTPFSSNSVRRLSKLSVRWIRLGIEPRLIQPGKPQQNGRLERMHRTLREQVCACPAANLKRQQPAFDDFVEEFNTVRPHEALGQRPPVRLYIPSERPYPQRLPVVEYPSSLQTRRVRSSGEIRWDGQWFFLSEALVGEWVAFEPVDDEISVVRFASFELGYYSARDKRLHLDRPRPAPPR